LDKAIALDDSRASVVACGIEVGAAQLVRRQGNGGFCIGHTQQGFRQAHQGQAFGAGNRVFLEQAVHRPEGGGWSRTACTQGAATRAAATQSSAPCSAARLSATTSASGR
jgi:hypothetical protein